jgi:hypothetical protein
MRTGIGPDSMARSCTAFAARKPAVKRWFPMIDTTTICSTPARSPTCCRLRAEAVKKSVAAACSDEGWVAASMMHATPARASARPSPVTTSTPLERDIGTTSCPSASSTSTR